jgi:hypothetical protein
MIRVTAAVCFLLTLLCPVVCLANLDGDACAAVEPNSENCEAMSIGAVFEKPVIGVASLHQLCPSLDSFLQLKLRLVSGESHPQMTRWLQCHTKPPSPALRRLAVLQAFLF